MIAAIATIGAAVFGISVFSKLGVGFGGFAAVGLGTAAFMAFTIAFGIVTVRMMQRREEALEQAEAEAEAGADERARAGRVGNDGSPNPASERHNEV